MSFQNSRFYGSRVERAKAERGWLSDEEFHRLGRQEFRDYRRGGAPIQLGGGGNLLVKLVVWGAALYGVCWAASWIGRAFLNLTLGMVTSWPGMAVIGVLLIAGLSRR